MRGLTDDILKDDWLEQRNKTASAISLGFPILPIGAILTVDSGVTVVICVSTRPGHTQLILIPSRE